MGMAGGQAASTTRNSRVDERLFDAQFVLHRLDLIAEAIGVENEMTALGCATSDTGQTLVLFRQTDFDFDLFQIRLGHFDFRLQP